MSMWTLAVTFGFGMWVFGAWLGELVRYAIGRSRTRIVHM
jgi:hypothetical protein